MVVERESYVLIFKWRQKVVSEHVDESCCSGVVHLDSQECILFFFEANDSIVDAGVIELYTVVRVCITHLSSYVMDQRTSTISIKKEAGQILSEVAPRSN
jgi:hypothetical protein